MSSNISAREFVQANQACNSVQELARYLGMSPGYVKSKLKSFADNPIIKPYLKVYSDTYDDNRGRKPIRRSDFVGMKTIDELNAEREALAVELNKPMQSENEVNEVSTQELISEALRTTADSTL